MKRHRVKGALFGLFAIAFAGCTTCVVYTADIPPRFAVALEAAAIQEDTLSNIAENSLLLGNGDLNGLLYTAGGKLQLRLTKNDVWDARLDTSRDQELPTINPTTHAITGHGGDPVSWIYSYPCPLACGGVAIDCDAASSWLGIRAEGKSNRWVYDGKHAIMSLEGLAGASCGWRTPVNCPDKLDKIVCRLSGTPNARYYLTALGNDGRRVESGWKDTPVTEQEVSMDLSGGMVVSALEIYTWTKDGQLAQNRFAAIGGQGPSAKHECPLDRVQDLKSDYRLDIRRAVATAPGRTKGGTVKIWAQADRNVFLFEGATALTLVPTTASFVPKAETGTREGVDFVLQTLPPDTGYPDKGDWPGMSFAIAKFTQGQRSAVAVVTSLESKDPLRAALLLAKTALSENPAEQQAVHEKIWADFWSHSQVDMADTFLRDVWYRNLYFMRCISKAGVKPVGLYAGLVNDAPAWHGDFHLNYNAQQTYWGWYNCDHAELSQPYEWLIERDLTRAKWFAKVTYDCGGAFFPYNIFMHEPVDPAACKSRIGRQMTFIPYDYTLGVGGWTVQNHWLHYKHYPSRELLKDKVYPLLKEVATFYADFADKCRINPKTGRIVFGPTYSPEHWNLGRVDGTCDIAFARLALKAAIEGARTLGVNASEAARWQKTLGRLPDYPLFTHKDGTQVVVDVADVPVACYNVPVPALPVYPAGEVTWFSPESEKTIFTNTIARMDTSGANSAMILAGSRIRLSMPDAYDWTRKELECRQRNNGMLSIMPRGGSFNGMGHFTEDFAANSVISEMLMQSVGGTIRIFPAWPKDKDAAFANLRAEGGFLVSAELKGGRIIKLEITPTVGGTLRLLNPWTGKIEERHAKPGAVIEWKSTVVDNK